MCNLFSRQDTSVFRGTRNPLEVYSTSGGLVGRKVGDIVLLQEERMPRQMWKKARIDELIPGRDGQIRTVQLRPPDRTKISRPVQLVIPLEIDQGGEDVED